MQRGGAVYRESIAATPVIDLTNRGHKVSVAGEHLWLTSVDDLFQ